MSEFAPLMRAIRERQLRVADLLSASGYEFCDPDGRKPNLDPPVGTPDPGALAEVNDILRVHEIGVPEAFKVFWEIVGSLEFQGVAPEGWSGCDYPDPVSIVPADPVFMSGEIERWLELDETGDDFSGAPGTFWFQVSGDEIHKAGY